MASGVPDPIRLERVLTDALSREPDSELCDEPGWIQLRTPSSPWPNHNKVLLAQLAAADVQRKIAEVLSDHRDRGARVQWIVGPSSAPTDLGSALRSAGLSSQGQMAGMIMPVPDQPHAPSKDLTLDEVGPAQVDEFAQVTADSWEMDDVFRDAAAHITRTEMRGGSPGTRRWIARHRGQAVGSCIIRVFPEFGYFQGCAVNPAFRGRGLYRAMIRFRLSVLRALGRDIAVVWANETTSGPVCNKLGFETICTATSYQSLAD